MGTHPTDDEPGIEAEESGRLLSAPPVQEPSEDRLRELRQCVLAEIRAQRPRRRRRRLVAVAVLGVAAAALFAGVTIAAESGSHRQHADDLRPEAETKSVRTESPAPYPTNANGQTYGPKLPDAGFPELMLAHAYRGENGYMYWEDTVGPVPALGEEGWFQGAFEKRREVPLYKSDGVTQVGVFVVGNGDAVAEQPPSWLFDRMKDMARRAGDARAWAWFALTTREQAAAATGSSTTAVNDRERPVYLTILLGDFTDWLWSLREGATAPEYSWIYQIVDPETHHVVITGAGTEPFEGATGLDLNIVNLRDRLRM